MKFTLKLKFLLTLMIVTQSLDAFKMDDTYERSINRKGFALLMAELFKLSPGIFGFFQLFNSYTLNGFLFTFFVKKTASAMNASRQDLTCRAKNFELLLQILKVKILCN